MIAVAIQPEIRLVEGELRANDLALLKTWVALNLPVLVQYWHGGH
jgi:hypothetical protein